MKKLVLMRHGKSSWEYDLQDSKRPLKPRGRRDAALVANEFKKVSELPERIFSSPAERAHETCRIFMESVGLSITEVEIIEELYDFGGKNVIDFISNLPETIDSVMIFGHNHAFTSITNRYGSKYTSNLPTSGLVSIEMDISSWKNLEPGVTKHLIIPKELR